MYALPTRRYASSFKNLSFILLLYIRSVKMIDDGRVMRHEHEEAQMMPTIFAAPTSAAVFLRQKLQYQFFKRGPWPCISQGTRLA